MGGYGIMGRGDGKSEKSSNSCIVSKVIWLFIGLIYTEEYSFVW